MPLQPPPSPLVPPCNQRRNELWQPLEKKNRGSEGHWGQTGHLAKTHPTRYGCDVTALLQLEGATSGMFDLDWGGPLVFKASQIKRTFHNFKAAGVFSFKTLWAAASRVNRGSWLEPPYNQRFYFDGTLNRIIATELLTAHHVSYYYNWT